MIKRKLAKSKTIRFHNRAKAEGFAAKTGGKFMECHSLEESPFKVRFKPSPGFVPTPKVRRNDDVDVIGNHDVNDPWQDYAHTADDL